MTSTFRFGQVAPDDLSQRDLYVELLGELDRIDHSRAQDLQEAVALNALEHDYWGELVDDLSSELNDSAPSYTYFGLCDGHYGFWVDDAELEQDKNDRVLFCTSDLRDIYGPENTCTSALVVNDHGNRTLYYWNIAERDWLVVWECV